MPRQCGDCQLCCKLLPVQSLGKEAGQRCKHQRHSKGCAVYAQLERVSPECRLWNCRWLVENDTADLRLRPQPLRDRPGSRLRHAAGRQDGRGPAHPGGADLGRPQAPRRAPRSGPARLPRAAGQGEHHRPGALERHGSDRALSARAQRQPPMEHEKGSSMRPKGHTAEEKEAALGKMEIHFGP